MASAMVRVDRYLDSGGRAVSLPPALRHGVRFLSIALGFADVIRGSRPPAALNPLAILILDRTRWIGYDLTNSPFHPKVTGDRQVSPASPSHGHLPA
jgi:hypothetical protein